MCSADLLKSAKEVFAAVANRSLGDSDSDDVDLYSVEENTDQSPDSTGAGVLHTNEPVSEVDEILSSPGDLEEEAKLSLAIQCSIDSSQRFVDEEEQLQKALRLSKEMGEGMDFRMEQLNQAISASLEEAVKASNTIQLQLFATQQSNLLKVDVAFRDKVRQGQVVEKLDHRTAGDMTEYDRKCLEAVERKHGVEIQIEGTIIYVSGFRKFVCEALYDVRLLLSRMSHSASKQEILKKVRWVFHSPVSPTTTPYSPDVIVFLENAWRMKMAKIEVMLDQQSHIINLREMREQNSASGQTVSISRELISSAATGTNQAGKVQHHEDFSLFTD